jgi:isopentenyl diphosphate isomerase/L-lactate dehydrogenase-like FMN-dependent dehydrogenase
MGGVFFNRNFILNCSEWKKIPSGPYKNSAYRIRLAPMTGAVENVGYPDEKKFYFDMIAECVKSGIGISLGDGTPDEKLKWGIEAVQNAGRKAAVFFKPYSNEKIFQRFEWAENVAEFAGVDIDAYNILTMRNSVHLEKKDSAKLLQLKKFFAQKNVPFVVKGIFTRDDVEMIKELKPDVAYVSNHGGRVETEMGSTAKFLEANFKTIKSNSGKIWVDGGIRFNSDCEKAASYGAEEILIGRPFVSLLCQKKSFRLI